MIVELGKTSVVGSDFDYQVVYFDPDNVGRLDDDASAEVPLRRVGLDTAFDHYPLFESFVDFLEFVVTTYQELLKLQQSTNIESNVEALLRDDSILSDLGLLLAGAEPEPEPAPEQQTPEMKLASRVCRRVLELLVSEELIEFDADVPDVLDAMEDNLLTRLLKSTGPEDAIGRWISFLSRAREVEELYGTDDDLKQVMTQAFEEASAH